MRRRRRNPEAGRSDRSFYVGTYTPDGKLVEAVQSTRTQALNYARRRAHPGEIIKIFQLPHDAPCLKLLETFEVE